MHVTINTVFVKQCVYMCRYKHGQFIYKCYYLHSTFVYTCKYLLSHFNKYSSLTFVKVYTHSCFLHV